MKKDTSCWIQVPFAINYHKTHALTPVVDYPLINWMNLLDKSSVSDISFHYSYLNEVWYIQLRLWSDNWCGNCSGSAVHSVGFDIEISETQHDSSIRKMPTKVYPGIQFSLACTPRQFFMGARLFVVASKMQNKVVIKHKLFGLGENAQFPWQPLIWLLRMGVDLQKQSYIEFY